MKPFLPFALAGLLLVSGCPDTKVPKAPPKVPEPKAASTALHAAPLAQPAVNGQASA
jgi:predicted component of type VI protein secretion system